MKSTYRTNIEECLRSDWFKTEMKHLARLAPFPFAVREEQRNIFSTGVFDRKVEKEIRIDESFSLTCDLPAGVQENHKNFVDNFCLLLENLLRQHLQTQIELDSLSSEILDKYEELNILYDFSQAIGTLSSPEKIFNIIIEKVELALNVDRASIMIYDEETEMMEIVATYGYEIKQIENPKVSLEKSISGYVLKNGQALLVDDLRQLPGEIELTRSSEYQSESFITVPMIFSPIQVNQNKIGVINVTEKRNRESFTSGDLKLLNSIASLAAIAIYNNRLLKKVLDSERLKRDLQIAEKIQMGLLPTKFPRLPDLELYGRCSPAKHIGGDYFDYFFEGEEWLDLLIADVSGHNVSAALMMANTRSVLRSLMHETTPVNEILRRANHLLFEDMNRAGFFISVFLLRYNRHTRLVHFANGGHHPVFLFQKQSKNFVKLDAEGLLLGVMPDYEFDEQTFQLSAGDILVMYTDGLIEAKDGNGQFFGYESLKRSVCQTAHAGGEKMVDEIFFNVQEFTNHAPQADDITLQIMKVKEPIS